MTRRLVLLMAAMAGAGLGLGAAGAEVAAPLLEADLQEFVVVTSSLARMLPVFRDVLRWEVKHQGPGDLGVAALWGLARQAKLREVLVGNKASTYGFVRLVEIEGVPQELARYGGRWWDTGGVLNIDVMVKDLEATVRGLRERGFTAIARPQSYLYPGDRRGVSAMMIGPDDLILSFNQRISPPLTTFAPFEGGSHIQIGYQIVKDLDAWHRFHTEVLGFASDPIKERASEEAVGPNDYRLPHNLVGAIDGRQVIVKPRKGGEQGIGGRQFKTSTGHDYEAKAAPPNIGIVAMRFPVKDLDGLVRRIREKGVPLQAEPREIVLAPYGTVRAFAVRTPGGSGAWLEFYQAR